MKIPYKIGATYIYPNDPEKKPFKLSKVKRRVFVFSCDHWCTDSVFVDLIEAETGKQVFEMIPNYTQIKLNLL